MNKKILGGILLTFLSSMLVACGGGGSSGDSGKTNPATITSVPIPPGFTEISTNLSSNAVAYDANTSQIAYPSAGNYTIITVPADVITAIQDADNNAATQIVNQAGNTGVIIVADNTVYWANPNSTVTLPTDSATGAAIQTLMHQPNANNLVSFNPINSTLYFVVIPLSSQRSSPNNSPKFGPTQCSLAPNTICKVTPTVEADVVPTAPCNTWNGNLSLVQVGSFNGVQFIAFGSSGGTVCVQAGDVGGVAPNNGTWTKLSDQVPLYRTNPPASNYTPSNVQGYAFHDNSTTPPTYYGFWSMSGPNNIYRISGSIDSNGNYTSTSFWNVLLTVPQETTSGSNATAAFVNPPVLDNLYNTCTGPGGTLYVTYTVGDSLFVYNLPKDSHNWGNMSQVINGISNGYNTYPSTGSGCDLIVGTSSYYISDDTKSPSIKHN